MKALHLVLRRIERFLLAGAILVMAGGTILNVIVRNLTGESLAATEEINQFMIVLVCFVGASYAAGEGRHIRMTAISDALPLRARRWLVTVVCGTTALLLLVLAYYAAKYALSVDRRSPVLGVPLGRVYWIAPAGLLLGALQYFMATVANLRGPHVYIAWGVRDGYDGDAADERVPAAATVEES